MDEKDYRDPSIVEMHDDLVSRYYKISARNEGQLNMLEKLFVFMEHLGRIGASRTVNVYVDGDGAISFRFSRHLENEYVFQELEYDKVMDQDSGYGNVRIDNDHEATFDLG